MGADQLRPLGLGEILDATFTLYRRHIWLFAGIAILPAIAHVPSSLVTELLLQSSSAGAEGNLQPAMGFVFAVAMGFILIFYFVAYIVALAATTLAVSDLYLGRPAHRRQALAHAWSRFGALLLMFGLIALRLLGFMLLLAVGVASLVFAASFGIGAFAILGGAIGFLAGMVTVMVVALRYSAAVPALVIEDLSPTQAIKRSVVLTGGHIGRLFLIGVLSVVITYITIIVFQGPFLAVAAFMPHGAVGASLRTAAALMGTLGSALSIPLMQIALVLVYYDLRVRKEGFDLQLLLDTLERGPAGAGVVPAAP